jgi:hypothetical protein
MMRQLGYLLLFLTTAPGLAADIGWNEPSTWIPIQIPGQQPAPEFVGITAWINSRPLTVADFGGKVVLVHFMSVGCRNCVRDYSWYKEVNKEFKDQGLIVVGIHTPATKQEENVGAVRREILAAGLTHPIAIDNQFAMWKQYYNQLSPSIYLFDKNGIARWGWRGELSWKGARGKAHMRKKIEELLAE